MLSPKSIILVAAFALPPCTDYKAANDGQIGDDEADGGDFDEESGDGTEGPDTILSPICKDGTTRWSPRFETYETDPPGLPMQDWEVNLANFWLGEDGEFACLVPDGYFKALPWPVDVPDMDDTASHSGVLCNYVIYDRDAELAPEAVKHLPWNTGSFVDAQGSISLVYPACAEPCSEHESATEIIWPEAIYNEPYVNPNYYCASHLTRHGIDPEGNGYNDGTPIYDDAHAWGGAMLTSACVAPADFVKVANDNTQWIKSPWINLEQIGDLADALGGLLGLFIDSSLVTTQVPWEPTSMFFTGGCEFFASGYKPLNGPNYWQWSYPCPDQYHIVVTDEHFDFTGWPKSVREGYCEMDGLASASNIPPLPPDLDAAIAIGDGRPSSWKGLVWNDIDGDEFGVEFSNWDSHVFVHPDLIDVLIESPELILDHVRFEDTAAGRDSLPALKILDADPSSFLGILDHDAGDVITYLQADRLEPTGDRVSVEVRLTNATIEGDITEILELLADGRMVTLRRERGEFEFANRYLLRWPAPDTRRLGDREVVP